jgi:5'-nucleotidase
MDIAKETEYINLIIGGHTHTFLDAPVSVINKAGRETIVNQVGWAGVRLGRLDYIFSSKKDANLTSAQSVIINK